MQMNNYFGKYAICYAQTETNFGICYMPKTPRKNFGKKVFRFGGVNRLLYRRGGDVNIKEDNALQGRELVAQVYNQYKNYMFSLAVKYIGDPRDCDDVIQDAVLRLLQNMTILKQLEGARLVSYINLTVRSAALDYLDKINCQKKYFEEIPYESVVEIRKLNQSADTVEEDMLKNERNQAIYNAMQRLPERARLLLIGKYYLCLEDKDLLALKGWQKQSLRTVLNRARCMLRKELEKEGIKDDKIL